MKAKSHTVLLILGLLGLLFFASLHWRFSKNDGREETTFAIGAYPWLTYRSVSLHAGNVFQVQRSWSLVPDAWSCVSFLAGGVGGGLLLWRHRLRRVPDKTSEEFE